MADTPLTKTCARCRVEKSHDAFHSYKRNRDGKFSYCKQCVSELRKEDRARRGDEIRDLENQRRRGNLTARLAVERRACKKRRLKSGYQESARAAATQRLYEKYTQGETTRSCEICRVEFCNVFGRHSWMTLCSDECVSERDRRHRISKQKARRAMKRRVRYEVVNPFKVLERDGYRCQLCGKMTIRDKRGSTHPRAPEMDHIVPLAQGGEHTYRNTQCACRSCNSAKGAGPGGQLLLFG